MGATKNTAGPDADTRVDLPGREQLPAIWQPLDIGPTQVKHRIMYTAQTILYGERHLLSDRHIAFYRERAKGGVALMITEQQAGHPIGKGSFYPGCSAHDKAAIPQYAKLAEAVHEFGARQFVQLYGPGVHDKGNTVFDEWHPLWAASRTTSIVHREVPMVMGQKEIDETAQAFGESALNVKTSGLDGVEIHAAHSYLLGQFLSPAYNKRDDRYGGTVQNRCRFPIEIAESIRRQVDGDITVGIRLSYDEYMGDVGITPEQTQEVVERFAATGLFDYLSISCGGYHTLYRTVSPMQVQEGFLEDAGKQVKEIVGDRVKVFLVGRIVDPAVANRLVAEGATDMAAMTRAQMADPFLVRKAEEGRTEDIVRCVGANICLAHAFDQKIVPCLMNPAMGRERTLGSGSLRQVGEGQIRRVTVIGGGPAGMKVAGTAAERGHDVVLLERSHELGGHLRLIERLPTRAGWHDAIRNLERPLVRNEVEVRTGVEFSADGGEDVVADAIVLANGARWVKTGVYSPYRPDRDHIPGAEDDNVHDVASATRLALDDPAVLGERVLVYDETGEYLPLGLAEVLATAEIDVEFMTPHFSAGEEVIRSMDWNWIAPRLIDHGVTFTAQHTIEWLSSGTAEVVNVFGGAPQAREVDSIVIAFPRVPNEELYGRTSGRASRSGVDVHRVGDALAPRRLEAVIYEAEVLARDL